MAARFLSARGTAALLQRSKHLSRSLSASSAAAAKSYDADDGTVSVRKGPSASSASSQQSVPRVRVPPFGLYSELFKPLGRGTSLLQMMDAMDDLVSSSGAVNSSFPTSRTLRSTTRTPWDAMEDATSFKLRLDMPGLTKEEVSVDVVEGNLSIKGEHKPVEGEDDWSSRSSGSYNITIKLPDNVKVDAIKAELKNGVLCVTAPKVEEVKKRVQVHVS